jgi:hypothetical protein
MRQDRRTNTPEAPSATPGFDVQMKDDKWHVFYTFTGAWGKQGYETYREAAAECVKLHTEKQKAAVANIQTFHVTRNGNPA